jgi:hypothetical protein
MTSAPRTTLAKDRALSRLIDPWEVVIFEISGFTLGRSFGHRLAFIVARGGRITGEYFHEPFSNIFVVSPWRWNHAVHQRSAAYHLAARLNDVLLENAPVEGPQEKESLLADIRESEEFAARASAVGDTATFQAHTAYIALCRHRLAKAEANPPQCNK